ncbi:MAG TPA: hypothetical protein VK447_19400 [Myxococcaceae bacterium]|nr:hypothetical protein [Myxococcaceae bacterium]
MNPPAPPDLRPLALGEIVDRTATFWRKNLGPLFRLFLGYQLVVYLMVKGYTLLGRRYFPSFQQGSDFGRGLGEDALFQQVAAGFGATVALGLVLGWSNWVAGVAGTRFAVKRMLGEPASLEDGVRRAFSRLGTTTFAFLASLLWAFGMLLVCMLPGIGVTVLGAINGRDGRGVIVFVIFAVLFLVLGMLAGLLWYALRFMLTSQVLAMEDVGAWEALRRAGVLISGKIGEGFMDRVAVRATVLYTAVIFLLLSINLVSSMPSLIIQSTYGNLFDPAKRNPDAVPQALLIPAELFQVAFQAVFAPILVIFAAVFYVDMRVRREGLDLELKLGSAPARD